jgi:prepilin-type N-terminal cleavage/methylation domain-containing protein
MQSFIEKKSKMHAINTRQNIRNTLGFTLVELMIVVALTGIAVIAIYRGYTAFSHSADAQEQIIEMQQNLRIGMYWLEKDLRRASMNEEEDETAGFLVAFADINDADTIRFTMDLTGGGTDGRDNDNDGSEDNFDPENIEDPPGTIIFYAEDMYGDGDLDDDGEIIEYSIDGNGNLRRNDVNAGNDVTIISNVDALNFVYFDKGNPELKVPPQRIAAPVAVGDLQDIDSIEVTLLVHTTNDDLRHTDKLPYENLQDEVIFDPKTDAVGIEKHFRRRAFSKKIKIRNAGL